MKFVWHFFFSVVTGLKTGGVLGTLYRYLLHGCGLDELFFRLWCNNRFFFFFPWGVWGFFRCCFFSTVGKKKAVRFGQKQNSRIICMCAAGKADDFGVSLLIV